MNLRIGQSSLKIRTGSQLAAVLIVLMAVFALPCCPRVDGWFTAAQAAAEPAESTTSHTHHHESGVQASVDNASDGFHKGHLSSTGSVDVLPLLGPLELAARLPLAQMPSHSLNETATAFVPRTPVPPPRAVIAN